MTKFLAAVLALVVVGGVATFVYLQHGTPPPAPAPTPELTSAPPRAADEPRIQYPVPAPADTPPLPALGESDSAVQDMLAGLFGRESLARFFYLDDMVRRFVATIDNLPRKTTSVRLMPVKPVPGPFVVGGPEGDASMTADNAFRYRPYVLAMEAVEAKRLVAAYAHFYPLFQAAYQELGYPNAYFNDRLVAAIDDMLASPTVPAPRLVQPKVLYQFADADLEARSAGQKIMLRMGQENAARVKAKLRAIRRELTGQASQP